MMLNDMFRHFFRALLFLCLGGPLLAQPLALPDLEARVTELEQAEKQTGTDADLAVKHYRRAIGNLKAAAEFEAKAKEYLRAMDQAPKDTAAHQQELQKLLQVSSAYPEDQLRQLSDQAIGQRLAQRRARINDLENELSVLSQNMAAQQARSEASRNALTTAKSQLQEVNRALLQAASAEFSSAAAEAARVANQARRHTLNAEINMLEAERASHDIRLQRSQAKQSLLERQLELAHHSEQQIQTDLIRRQAREAISEEKQAAQAEARTVGRLQVLTSAAETNVELSQNLSDLVSVNATNSQLLKHTQSQRQYVDRNYQRALQQLEITKLDKTVGEFLRSQRSHLPDLFKFEQEKGKKSRELAEARLAQFHLQGLAGELINLQQQRDHLLSSVDKELAAMSAAERSDIAQQLLKLLSDRKDLIKKLDAAYSQNIKLLDDLVLEQQHLIDTVGKYRTLLDKNLLWIANVAPITWTWVTSFGATFDVVFSLANWLDAATSIYRLARVNLLLSIAVLLLVGTLFVFRLRLHKQLATLAQDVGNVQQDRFTHTLTAVAITILLILPWPILMRYAGWLLQGIEADTFPRAVGSGLWYGSEVFLAMAFFRALYIKHGLGESHFRWAPRSRRIVSRHLIWLMPVLVVTAIIIGMTESAANGLYRDTIGRLTHAIQMSVLPFFAWRILRRRSAVIPPPEASRHPSLAWRVRYLWYPLALIAPLVLMGLAAQGYYFTSLQLSYLIFRTVIVVVLAVLLYQLAVRWLLVAQQRLALQRARAKRQSDMEARITRENAEQAGEILPENIEMPEIGLEIISEHTRRLIRLTLFVSATVILWFAWKQIAPAFSVLDDITLWEYTVTGTDGNLLVPISLADLGLATIVLLLTFAAQRNLPGLLEIAVLQPLAVEPGNRFAVISIIRYVIVTLGATAALILIGVRWEQVQWLIAALGVGIGFGLKDIVANFMSGLIILIERPIRLGDTVTIGDISGVVSRIRIRSTTVTDWDNKELVIPNQQLVVDPVINWTLSDPITRVIIKIGIAYGSDTEKALRIMVETINANPLVLAEPSPTVFFVGFGDSSLNFEARVFVRDRIQRLTVTHELHMALERAFRQNHIEIPFPQRDLHLRTITRETPTSVLPGIDPADR